MAWSSPRTFVTGETVTAAHLNQEIRDNLGALNPLDSVGATSWAPTLEATTTDPATSSNTGRYWRVGPLVVAEARFVIDGAGVGAGLGTYFVTLPLASSGLAANSSSGQSVGSGFSVDNDTSGNSRTLACILAAASQVRFRIANTGQIVNESTPFSWAASDVLSLHVVYFAA